MKPFNLALWGVFSASLLAATAQPTQAASRPTVVPLPAIPQIPASSFYAVKVNGQTVPVNDESRLDFHTAAFTMSGPVTVEVTVSGAEDAQRYVVRPLRYKIAPQVSGKTLTFSISKPLKLVINAGPKSPNLALLATPAETKVPKPTSKNVLYFAPGVQDVGVIHPQSGQTLYFAPGARVKGRIEARGVKNVTVKGRGILDASAYSIRAQKTTGILFSKCSNIKVEGIGVRGGTWWQTLYLDTDNVEVSHLNILGKTVNTDGIDIDGARNFVARDCFIRGEDDGLGWHALDAKTNGEIITDNALAQDCVIWNSGAGNGIRVGASMESPLFQNVTFRNIDILHHAGAAIYSDHSDWAWCKNIRFQNVTDETSEGEVIHMAIAKTRYSNDNGYRDERGHFEGLHFKNVSAPAGKVVLLGFDATHLINSVSFQNCRVGDKPLRSLTDVTVNEWVKNVSFK